MRPPVEEERGKEECRKDARDGRGPRGIVDSQEEATEREGEGGQKGVEHRDRDRVLGEERRLPPKRPQLPGKEEGCAADRPANRPECLSGE